MHRIRWLSLGLVASAMFTQFGCRGYTPGASLTSTPSLERQTGSMTIDGKTRAYILVRAGAITRGNQVPLVVVMHGYDSSPNEIEHMLRFDQAAVQHNLMVVYPEGYRANWNTASSDDIDFIKQLVDRLVSQGQVDPQRIFATGWSRGGIMAHYLACAMSDRFAAVASIAGKLLEENCQPARPISVMELHRELDQIEFAVSSMERWSTIDQCGQPGAVVEDSITKTTTWAGCAKGTSVTLVVFKNGGHEWFNLIRQPDVTDLMWTFFSQSSKATDYR